MIDLDPSSIASGPRVLGSHKCAALLSQGISINDNGTFDPVGFPKEMLADLADAPRDGEALLRILRAGVGSDSPANDLMAIGTRFEELLRQLDPSHIVPPHRKRSKQTASHAGKTMFKALDIDRLATGRSSTKETREATAKGVKDWWDNKKPTVVSGGVNEAISNLPKSASLSGESSGEASA